jgi:hypothetical protein
VARTAVSSAPSGTRAYTAVVSGVLRPLNCPNWWAQQVTILRPLACKAGQPGRWTWLDEAQCAVDQRRRSLTVAWRGLVSAVVGSPFGSPWSGTTRCPFDRASTRRTGVPVARRLDAGHRLVWHRAVAVAVAGTRRGNFGCRWLLVWLFGSRCRMIFGPGSQRTTLAPGPRTRQEPAAPSPPPQP